MVTTASSAALDELTCAEGSLDTIDLPLTGAQPFQKPSLNPWRLVMSEAGVETISDALVWKLEAATGRAVPSSVRHGLALHSQLDVVLSNWLTDKEPFYIVLSKSMAACHIGHLPALQLAQWLQAAFHMPVIVHAQDDESFMRMGPHVGIHQVHQYTWSAVCDALAAVEPPFDLNNTYAYSALAAGGMMYPVTCRVLQKLSVTEAKYYTGTQQSQPVGQLMAFATSITPLFAESFPVALGRRFQTCVRVGAVEQASTLCVARSMLTTICSRVIAGVFTQYVPSHDQRALLVGQSPTIMHATVGTIVVGDSPSAIRAKLQLSSRETLLQLLWWFHTGTDETLDWLSWHADVPQIRNTLADVLDQRMIAWRSRRTIFDPMNHITVERPLVPSGGLKCCYGAEVHRNVVHHQADHTSSSSSDTDESE